MYNVLPKNFSACGGQFYFLASLGKKPTWPVGFFLHCLGAEVLRMLSLPAARPSRLPINKGPLFICCLTL